jgi:chromosome segregation ATPase
MVLRPDPAQRDRLLWRHFEEAKQTHARLEHAIQLAREALDVERPALVQAQAEHEALATRPLPTTIEEEASGIRADAVRRYQSVGIECQQRAAAVAELERLLPAPEQALGPLTEAVTGVLEAVETVYREAVAHRVSESGELEHFRSRFERLRAEANAHAAEIEEWSQRVGRPLRIPRIAFSWPPDPVWQALLDSAVEGPKLVWDDDSMPPSA